MTITFSSQKCIEVYFQSLNSMYTQINILYVYIVYLFDQIVIQTIQSLEQTSHCLYIMFGQPYYIHLGLNSLETIPTTTTTYYPEIEHLSFFM